MDNTKCAMRLEELISKINNEKQPPAPTQKNMFYNGKDKPKKKKKKANKK